MPQAPKPKRLTRVERMAREATKAHPPVQQWGTAPPQENGSSRVRMLIDQVGTDWADLLALVADCGYGLTVSATRDGGALSLSLLTDTGPQKRYAGHPDELVELITALRAYLTQIKQGQMVLPGA